MAKKSVAILFGGRSVEHEVSISSALSIYQALDKAKYDITLIGIDHIGRWLMPDQKYLISKKNDPRSINLDKTKEELSVLPSAKEQKLTLCSNGKRHKFDIVFPIVHGTYGEDGTLQGLLELATVPYVGAGVLGSAVGMDKEVARRLMKDAGLPVVNYVVARHGESPLDQAKKKFGFPMFIKPANMGSSVGVFKVNNEKEVKDKIKSAFQYDNKVLIEQAIDARELECSVLGNDKPDASVIGEIIPKGGFYDYEAKYISDDGAVLKYPAENLPKAIAEKVRSLAVKAFIALECSGMARVDFFLDKKSGEIFINEINTLPGFTKMSMYPKLWEASGLPYTKLLDKLIDLALEKHAARMKLKTTYL